MALSPVRLRASISVGSADTIAFTRSNSPALMASMNAAAPVALVSAMLRFYRVICVLLVSAFLASPAQSQTAAPQPPSQIRPPLTSTLDLDLLRDLPTANTPLAAIETIQPEAIGDRFTAGGLNVAS